MIIITKVNFRGCLKTRFKVCVLFYIGARGKNFAFSFAATASWEADSVFRLPIDGGLQNTLPTKKVLAATAIWETRKSLGAETRTFCRLKNLWEAAESGFRLPKKLAFRQNVTLPPGGIINSANFKPD